MHVQERQVALAQGDEVALGAEVVLDGDRLAGAGDGEVEPAAGDGEAVDGRGVRWRRGGAGTHGAGRGPGGGPRVGAPRGRGGRGNAVRGPGGAAGGGPPRAVGAA